MFSIFAFADVPECRPSDAPPYDDELTADDDAVISFEDAYEQTFGRSIHDEEVEMAREATLFPAPASPWVRRAQMRDLPTFDRHNGAFAYEER